MFRFVLMVALSFILLFSSACSASRFDGLSDDRPPLSSPGASPAIAPLPSADITDTTDALPSQDAVVQLLKASLSREIRLSEAAINLKEIEAVEWSDSCLGLSQPEEFCAQMITPGYQVTFTTAEKNFVVHSDRTGESYRIAPSR
jgi:hypothetical protein